MFIRSKENESLRDFINRFNATTMIMKGVFYAPIIQSFLVGTTHKNIQFHIIGNPLEKLSQLYEIVYHFMEGDQIHIDQVKPLEQVTQGSHFPKRPSPLHHYHALAHQYQPYQRTRPLLGEEQFQ